MEARREGTRSVPRSSRVPEPPPQDQAALVEAVARSSPEALLATDRDGLIVWANHATARLFGFDVDALPGRPVTDLVTSEARPGLKDLQQRIFSGDRCDPFRALGLRADGSRFELSVAGEVRRDAGGRPLGASMAVRDVTGQAQLGRDLADALARSRARFEASAHPQALLDGDGRIVEVNAAVCELLGWTRPELVGRPAADLLGSTTPAEVRGRLKSLRDRSRRSASHETVGVCKDGTHIPLLVDVTAVRDDQGAVHEFAVFVQDLRAIRDAERRLVSQEAFFRGLHREASDITLVTDAAGAIRYVTPSVTQVLGYGPEQLRDNLTSAREHADDTSGQGERRRVLEVPGARERDMLRFRDAEGRWRWFDTTATNCVDDPDIAGIVTNLREVTPEIEAQQALRESEARYRAIAETAQEGILAVSPEGETLFANERLAEILGLSMEQVYALGGSGVLPSVEAGPTAPRSRRPRPQLRPDRSDVPYQHPDGRERVLLVSASPLAGADGTVLGTLAMVSDVTDQRAAEETLRRQALHDPLTGLPNRLLFVDRLTRAAARQRRTEHGHVAVLFLDLDHFKAVNDTHGHQAGDRVLVEVAARLEQAVRTTDTVARLGGDEFAVICEGADPATAKLVASRVHHAFKEPVAVDGDGLALSMSIGVALSPPHHAEDLLQLADMAMYQAKATARGRVVTYDESLTDDAARRLGVTRVLREAIDSDAVPLWYEPVVDLRSGELRGLHASLHWEHPTLGVLGQDEVTGATESAGLNLELHRALCDTALRDLAELAGEGMIPSDAFVVVPVLPASVDRRLTVCVTEALREFAVRPEQLLVEVPETVVRDEPDRVRELAGVLGKVGVGLQIGAGGAAGVEGAAVLGSPSGLEVRCLELDGSVLGRLGEGPDWLARVRGIVQAARSSGATVAVAGVVSEQEAAALRDVGCAWARGPRWAEAAPVDALEVSQRESTSGSDGRTADEMTPQDGDVDGRT